MATRDLQSWKTLCLAAAARGTLGTDLAQIRGQPEEAREDFVRTFADDAGHRRPVDRPLLTWCVGTELPPPAPGLRRDVLLWWGLSAPDGAGVAECLTPEGPLCPELRAEGIEVWTEAELASLQALWWHAWRRPDPALTARALAGAAWLMAELQPDNATNRPWALAIFAELASRGDIDAVLYAETLLHNCQVLTGRPDRLSSVLLRDAARRIDATLEA